MNTDHDWLDWDAADLPKADRKIKLLYLSITLNCLLLLVLIAILMRGL